MSLRPLLYSLLASAPLAIWACGSSATTNVAGPTAARCQMSVTNSSSGFAPAGGTGEVRISVARECAWSATTQSPWIAITAGQQGQGDGTISYRVTENADPVNRSDAIVVGDHRVSVAQQGAPCRFTLSGPSQPLAAAGDVASVDVRTHSACSWTAAADVSWVSLAPATGQGDAIIRVQAAPNAGTDRVVTVTVGGDRVTLRQDHAPIPPAPTPTPAPPPGPTNPGPTDPPNDPPKVPPPPAPPAPIPVALEGKVNNVRGSCPALTFDLKGFQVRTSAATAFPRAACKDLKNGKDATVTGVQKDPKQPVVDATSVEFKK